MRTKPMDVRYCGVDEKKIKSANPTLNKKRLRYLYGYIKKRYCIHLRKDVLNTSPPWTRDEILQSYRFTNVRREHDRESKWVIQNIASNSDLYYDDKLLNMVLFRLFNMHQTAELLSMPIQFSKYGNWNPEWYRSLFEAAKAENPNAVFFTGAFYTSGLKRILHRYLPEGVADSPEMRMLYFIAYLYRDHFSRKVRRCKSQQEVFDTIGSYDGMGKFLSYQIFVDMTYIEDFPFSENEFTVAGYGCTLGIDALFLDKDGMTYEECLFWLRDNLDEVFRKTLGKDWRPEDLFWDLPEYDQCLNVMSLENLMCELSKYTRAREGNGRPRKRYIP